MAFSIDQYDTQRMLDELLKAGIVYEFEDDWDTEQRLNHIVHLFSSMIVSTNWADREEIAKKVYSARKSRGQQWK